VLLREDRNISVRRLAKTLRVNKNTSARMIAQIDSATAKASERALLQQIVQDVTRR